MKDTVIIYGPTAVGKSDVAIELAKMIDGEIISADSMQVYKGLNIGSAKVTMEEMQGIPHYLIDIKEPNEDYSVAEFCCLAKNCIDDITSRNKTPIIVGGTGLYIKGLTSNYNFASVEKNVEFRNNIERFTNEQIYKQILELDNDYAIDKNNRQRLIRALEILKFGKKQSNNKADFTFKLFAITDDRQKIYERINKRVEKMVDLGLLDEAKYLFSLNLPDNNLAIKAIGYKELFPYIKGEDSLQNCVDLLKQKTRNYAKRQITFLNQFDNIKIINFCGVKNTAEQIKKELQ